MDDTVSVNSSTSPENDIFAIDESFAPSQSTRSATIVEMSLDGLLTPSLLLREDLKDGCGGQLWPAGKVLATYMLTHHQEDLAGQTIIELGAGGGFVGLAVARGCAFTPPLILTDQLPMLSLMRQNISLNKLSSRVLAGVYGWGSPVLHTVLDEFKSTPGGMSRVYPDVILAADCVYFEPAFPLLLQTMCDLLGPSTVCYFCFKKRRKADWRFVREMGKKTDAQLVEYDNKAADQKQRIYLYEVKKKVK